MEQNYRTTRLPTSASQQSSIGGAYWDTPSNILADDANVSWIGYFSGGDSGGSINGTDFDYNLPENAVIDGIVLSVDGQNIGCYGNIDIGITGTSSKDIGTLSGDYGDATDLWGASEITVADLADLSVTVLTGDVSGGDGYAEINYFEITVYWHIDMSTAPADVPVRVDYKVYSSDGDYLGLIPKVESELGFPQDINSAGSTIEIVSRTRAENEVTVEPLLTEAGEEILTESGLPLLAAHTNYVIAPGDSEQQAIFKNGNRVKAWLYNYWHPNGKLMFSGQINKIAPAYTGEDGGVKVTVMSDGLDLSNYVARGYPFSYTTDQSQTSDDTYLDLETYSYGGWIRYGQTWRTGAGVTNIGAIRIQVRYTADVTLTVYDRPNGNVLGSVTKSISNPTMAEEEFEFPSLIEVEENTDYFMALSCPAGQNFRIRRNSAGGYANGAIYESSYSGGSGGGSYAINSSLGDFWFITKSGTPTTITTYSTQDPVTGMMSSILLDYNNRGGLVTERDFEATGLSLTNTFNLAFILDAAGTVLSLAPAGYYMYVDLGTAEMDMLPTSETPDFTVVKGRHLEGLDPVLSIENLKNYLYLIGGDTGGGTNLFRKYEDTTSISRYGLRSGSKSDNRVTLTATADAIGDTFIEENAIENQETSITVLDTAMDITLLTPGKTIGFRNFGNFIDDFVLKIVRREYTVGAVTLTLGKLPVRMNDEVQRINRELLNEQSADNPSAPS